MVDRLNGNLGNVNGFLFGKKVEKEEAAKTETPKENVPVGQPQAAEETAKVDKTNLNLDMNAIMGLHLTQKAQKTDVTEQAVGARAAELYASADFQALNKEFGIYDDVDPEIGQFLSPKVLSYITQAAPEVRERIGAGVVVDFENIVAA